ncbi:MAG: M48 family metalloprotease [Candidatus Omnitrophica bacterium]|nr:M48 family metalloprotease [Candidatus Omnitrophota bacterium]
MQRYSGFCVIISLAFSFIVSGCATTYNPATGQKEFIFITTPMEVSLGNKLASKISKDFKISSDSQKIDRVNEIGKKVVDVCDRKDLEYKFAVIEDDELNAFTTPGGYVYINSGIIKMATDDELACVIGHEVGHVAARHIAKKLQAQIGYDILLNIAATKADLGELQQAVSISYDLVMLGYSRGDELLSDRLGVKYAYKAGYDPYAMITFLEKLKDTEKERMGPVFLRSHPYTSQRIKMINKQISGIIDKVDHVEKKPVLTQATEDKTNPLKVMCPECKRIFSGKTNYCPYDGTKLQ